MAQKPPTSAPAPREDEPRPEAGTDGAQTGAASGPRPGKDRSWTVAELLGWTVDKFSSVGIEGPRVDAEHLLAQALGCSRMELYVQHDRLLSAQERGPFREMIARRLAREPVAYILGRRGFHALDLELHVNKDVLIPRPETEHLVDWILEELRPVPAPPMTVVDVGTGSGAIALAVKRARGDVSVLGVDVSPAAIEVARGNGQSADLAVEFVVGDLREGLSDVVAGLPAVAAVAANLPYIPAKDVEALAPEVALHEPRLALDGGPDGLDLVRALTREVASNPAFANATLYLEVGAGQDAVVAEILDAAGFGEVAVRRDFAGIGRVVRARAPAIAQN